MTRQDALDAQRSRGLPTLAVLPLHVPREILDSLDILGIELWGPPGPLPAPPRERIQPYVCSLVRNAMTFIDTGGLDGVDGVLFPATCDSMTGLASMVGDLVPWDRPRFHLHLPRATDDASAHAFIRREIEDLWHALGQAFDRPRDPERLARAIATREAIEDAHRRLRRHRRQLPMGERELMELLRRDGYRRADEHLDELTAALALRQGEPIHDGPGVAITGIVPEPMALLDTLEEAGAVLVGDDYGSTGRRLPDAPPGQGPDDPLDRVAWRLSRRPPCSTLSRDTPRRMDHLVDLVRRTGARGLIVHAVRFCEPELFDHPAIKDRMQREEIPALFVDTEVERDAPGPLLTRLEAFVEMLT